MFINIYKNPKTRNCFRYETFIHLFEFKDFSTRGERDTIFLCWLLLHRQLSTQPTRGARSAQSRLVSPCSESHFPLSFIASGRSSELHPVFSHSCCMYVRAGRPAFAWPYAGVHWSTSLMSSSMLLQQCPACLVRLACIVFVMGGRWPYTWCLVGCCCRDLFNIARNILV